MSEIEQTVSGLDRWYAVSWRQWPNPDIWAEVGECQGRWYLALSEDLAEDPAHIVETLLLVHEAGADASMSDFVWEVAIKPDGSIVRYTQIGPRPRRLTAVPAQRRAS